MVLLSLKEQTFKNFEVIIADDGSKLETKKLIEKYQLTFPLIHAWHEDKGFRKSKIHNQAIKMSCGDLLVFIDGDCICRKDFLQDHVSIYRKNKDREKSYVFMGRRVELGKTYTQRLSPQKSVQSLLGTFPFRLWLSCLSGDSRSFLRTYSVKNSALRKILKADEVNDLLGCNFSLPKKTLLSINGFNEDLDGGNDSIGEDGDIFVRLRNSGVKTIGKKYFAPMFHLYHERQDRAESDHMYREKLKNTQYKWAENGHAKKTQNWGRYEGETLP
jgi:glycosyltransferase involved in cell wall biosynthesis